MFQRTENTITPSPPSSTSHYNLGKKNEKRNTLTSYSQTIAQNPNRMKDSISMKSKNHYNAFRITHQSIHKQYPHRAGRIRVNKQFCTSLEISAGIAEEENYSEDNGEEDDDLLSYVAFSKSK